MSEPFVDGGGVINLDGPGPQIQSLDVRPIRFDGFLPDMRGRLYTGLPQNGSIGYSRTNAQSIEVFYSNAEKSGIPIKSRTTASSESGEVSKEAQSKMKTRQSVVYNKAAALGAQNDFCRLRPQLVHSPQLLFDEVTLRYVLKKQRVILEDLFTGPALQLLRAILPAIQQGNRTLLLRTDKDGGLDLPVNNQPILAAAPLAAHDRNEEDFEERINLIPTFQDYVPIEFFDKDDCRLGDFSLECASELLQEDVVSAISAALLSLGSQFKPFTERELRGRVGPNALFDVLEEKSQFLLEAAATGSRQSCFDPLVAWIKLRSHTLAQIAQQTAHTISIPAFRDRLPIAIGEAQAHSQAMALVSAELLKYKLIPGYDESSSSTVDPMALDVVARLVVSEFSMNRLDRTSIVLDRPTVSRRILFDRKKALRDWKLLPQERRGTVQFLVGLQ